TSRVLLSLALVLLSPFFSHDTATTEIYTLSLHDALPIWDDHPTGARAVAARHRRDGRPVRPRERVRRGRAAVAVERRPLGDRGRSEEHTSELQSRENLVCRLLLEKKKKKRNQIQERRVQV